MGAGAGAVVVVVVGTVGCAGAGVVCVAVVEAGLDVDAVLCGAGGEGEAGEAEAGQTEAGEAEAAGRVGAGRVGAWESAGRGAVEAVGEVAVVGAGGCGLRGAREAGGVTGVVGAGGVTGVVGAGGVVEAVEAVVAAESASCMCCWMIPIDCAIFACAGRVGARNARCWEVSGRTLIVGAALLFAAGAEGGGEMVDEEDGEVASVVSRGFVKKCFTVSP